MCVYFRIRACRFVLKIEPTRFALAARDEAERLEVVRVAAAVAVGTRRAESDVVYAAEFAAVVARGSERGRGRGRGRRGEREEQTTTTTGRVAEGREENCEQKAVGGWGGEKQSRRENHHGNATGTKAVAEKFREEGV